eukprot:CAMPEP_0119309138 /NCGR_PEP_ID=MMETSP1333-20130426/14277_1 /TAXON_ID=418940 /ORGANISM="Scyphosphaera apsteinii, Strain RCC1455" /LENGTH=141 /DNA_ID=CAMNT_0007313063 /DNA_START=26 /DNA_END=451 /DNA_ORIENTATION=-
MALDVTNTHLALGSLVLVLVILVVLNVVMCRKLIRTRKGREVFVDWTQTLDEVEITVPLPDDKSSKDVECRVLPTSFFFAIKGLKPYPMLHGKLFKPVQSDQSNWQLWPVGAEPGKPRFVKVNLIKQKSSHWKDVLAPEED